MCRSEYRGGFRRGLLISHGTDSVRTNLAGSVGVKTANWEFKYHFGFKRFGQGSIAPTAPRRPAPTPPPGARGNSPKMIIVLSW